MTLCLTGGAFMGERFVRRRRHLALRRLAADWNMHFDGRDQVRLASIVARHFPIPGAANVRVRDVIYGADADRTYYVFTTEYTIGVMRTKHRHVQAAAFSEARDPHPSHRPQPVILASEDVPLLKQYEQLAPSDAPAPSPITPREVGEGVI